MSNFLSGIIFFAFIGLLIVAATTTTLRYIAYRREGLTPPRLLPRDRDVFIGLALPFLLVAAARMFNWDVRDGAGDSEVWWVLLTGLPAVFALARYVYFELVVIEK